MPKEHTVLISIIIGATLVCMLSSFVVGDVRMALPVVTITLPLLLNSLIPRKQGSAPYQSMLLAMLAVATMLMAVASVALLVWP